MAQYQLRITIEKVSQGDVNNQNALKQSVGQSVTIMTAINALDVNTPSVTDVLVTDAQVTSLFGHIGVLNIDVTYAAIDTSTIDNAVATVVSDS